MGIGIIGGCRPAPPTAATSDDDGGDCSRKVLWAAYVDPRSRGNEVEEYQYYDLSTGEWDDRACAASGKRHRCVRMDCHEPGTHFRLVGVMKETDGMYDFTEQLFKHEGYCIWEGEDGGNSRDGNGGGDGDGNTYETMETWMENWPTECQELNNPDYYGEWLVDVRDYTPTKQGSRLTTPIAVLVLPQCLSLALSHPFSFR